MKTEERITDRRTDIRTYADTQKALGEVRGIQLTKGVLEQDLHSTTNKEIFLSSNILHMESSI